MFLSARSVSETRVQRVTHLLLAWGLKLREELSDGAQERFSEKKGFAVGVSTFGS